VDRDWLAGRIEIEARAYVQGSVTGGSSGSFGLIATRAEQTKTAALWLRIPPPSPSVAVFPVTEDEPFRVTVLSV
jgi:hypothetical protein